MSSRTLKSLMKSYGIKWDDLNGGYHAPYSTGDPDEQDWEFVGNNLDEVIGWLAEQGEEVCAEAVCA